MVAPPDNDVLWARALHVKHNGSPALSGVSLGVREGEILAVGGPRGSGKTTLLRCLSGQLLPDQGEVWFNSTPVHTMGPLTRERLRRDRFGWIDPTPVLVPELNAWENAALPLMLRGCGRRAAKTAALEWLERLDIGGCARKRPHAPAPRPSASASPSPARWSPRPPCSSPTSRPPRCTAPTAPRCCVRSPRRPVRTASPSSWPRTTRTPRRSPTARCRCSTDGA